MGVTTLHHKVVTATKDVDGKIELGRNQDGKIEVQGTWTHVHETMKQQVPAALRPYLVKVTYVLQTRGSSLPDPGFGS